MKKYKFFLYIVILTIVFLFGTSALLDRCGTPAESKAGVDEGKETEETMEEKQDVEEEKTDGVKEEGETEETETPEDETLQSPSINLVIYEGPTYSADDDVCHYRVEAIVTGSPAPAVTFSKDDSNGAWGPLKVQVNLVNPGETYTLTAAAKNSEGEATDSIELSWGCNPTTKDANNNPEVSEINIAGGTPLFWADSKYDISATASDPDGDNLTYYWSVSGGSIDDIYSNPAVWNTPDSAGTYSITVSVNDGNGGFDAETINVNIAQVTYPAIFTREFPIVTSEGGMIEYDNYGNDTIPPISSPYGVGDTGENKYRISYISFDISGLSGTIKSAHLTFNLSSQVGNPASFTPLGVWAVHWGAEPIVLDTRLHTQIHRQICEVNVSSFSADNGNLKSELLRAMENGWNRFQIVVSFTGDPHCDYDNQPDSWLYDVDDISLIVTYQL